MIRTATISDCGNYRYTLGRQWSPSDVTAVFIMLNPSTADDQIDDPTIRRCIGFARREGCGGIEVVNLFAWRATNPTDLPRDVATARGPDNQNAITAALADCSIAVAAWGAGFIKAALPRLNVERIAADLAVDLMCLGTTKDGHPRHPLYVKSDTPFVPFSHPQ